MAQDDKLDWIYKNANSLVDREEYLLGRKIDKPLEQLNEEEKIKKFVLPTPKNHVEHECIPPSIRDFNKIVQSEQVDLSAKLQEDPLVAIKKREEEARRQFLQNPVQLKKLQEAMKKKEIDKKKKKKHSDEELDEKIKRKLTSLKSGSLGINTSKKAKKTENNEMLNTILMHKFNLLKDKLSEDDLKNIMDGKPSDDSEDDSPKGKKDKDLSDDDSSNSMKNEEKRSRMKISSKRDNYKRNRINRSDSSDDGRNDERRKDTRKEYLSETRRNTDKNKSDYRRERSDSRNREADRKHYNKRTRSSHDEDKRQRPNHRIKKSRSRSPYRNRQNYKSGSRYNREDDGQKREQSYHHKKRYSSDKDFSSSSMSKYKRKNEKHGSSDDSETELGKNVMARLRLYRGVSVQPETSKKQNKSLTPPKKSENENSNKRKTFSDEDNTKSNKKVMLPERPPHLRKLSSSSDSDSSDDSRPDTPKYKYSDSEDEKQQTKSFGLVTSDGKKIALKKTDVDSKLSKTGIKKAQQLMPDRKKVHKMSEEEKDRLRKEMMQNAQTRDKEREENVRRYKDNDKREEDLSTKDYDADMVQQQLMKSAKHSSMEKRIRSKLNTIQRSSRHMDHNFSKR